MYSEYFKEFIEEKNIKSSTVDGYRVAIKSYSIFNGMSVDDLVAEAISEENSSLSIKQRSIRGRLSSYRKYLIDEDKSKNTIKTYLSKISTFYRFFDIELPVLPDVKYKENYRLNYSDLPTKHDIEKVLSIVSLDFKALILFMSSSGTSKAETLSLTVGDFIRGCGNFKSEDSLDKILNNLSEREDIVPTIYLRRIKTDKYYYTFCSQEASYYIVKYLRTRTSLSFEDKLFPFSSAMITTRFQRINDYMGWGRKGKYRFFRAHVLRKFHASNIALPAEYVDALQGRQKSILHDAYIKTDPAKLKQLYVENMSNVMIYNRKGCTDSKNSDDIHITINIFLSDMQLNLY